MECATQRLGISKGATELPPFIAGDAVPRVVKEPTERREKVCRVQQQRPEKSLCLETPERTSPSRPVIDPEPRKEEEINTIEQVAEHLEAGDPDSESTRRYIKMVLRDRSLDKLRVDSTRLDPKGDGIVVDSSHRMRSLLPPSEIEELYGENQLNNYEFPLEEHQRHGPVLHPSNQMLSEQNVSMPWVPYIPATQTKVKVLSPIRRPISPIKRCPTPIETLPKAEKASPVPSPKKERTPSPEEPTVEEIRTPERPESVRRVRRRRKRRRKKLPQMPWTRMNPTQDSPSVFQASAPSIEQKQVVVHGEMYNVVEENSRVVALSRTSQTPSRPNVPKPSNLIVKQFRRSKNSLLKRLSS